MTVSELIIELIKWPMDWEVEHPDGPVERVFHKYDAVVVSHVVGIDCDYKKEPKS